MFLSGTTAFEFESIHARRDKFVPAETLTALFIIVIYVMIRKTSFCELDIPAQVVPWIPIILLYVVSVSRGNTFARSRNILGRSDF